MENAAKRFRIVCVFNPLSAYMHFNDYTKVQISL